jgi:hypothetical protein
MNVRTMLIRLLAAAAVLAATGCSITQEVTSLSAPVRQVCIVQNEAVREGVLEVLQEAFAGHRASTRVITGTYSLKHNQLNPEWLTTDASGCDALTFYTANWRWDLAMYMAFANIWMTDPNGSVRLAQATYDATAGGGRMDKFIDARGKIFELVDQMYAGTPMVAAAMQPASTPPRTTQADQQATQSAPASSDTPLPVLAERLRALERLRDEGLVNTSEYETKRQQLINEL